jgi:protein-export membrane protein SecD
MTRGMFYKAIFIVIIIIFAFILVWPTIGTKQMEIYLTDDITPEELNTVMKRFSSDQFEVKQKEDKIIVEAAGINITDAVMNEVRVFRGVKNAKILPGWAEKAILAKKINLGLDLQGGMHLVMMADFNKIKKQQIEERERLLERKKALEADLLKQDADKDNIKEEIKDTESLIKDINDNKLNEEGDLRDSYKNEITQQALEMLRNRVDKFGVSEPSIVTRGNEAIEIQLPGVRDPASVKKAIGTTGSVQYRLVNNEYTEKVREWLAVNYKKDSFPASVEAQDELLERVSEGIKLPKDLELLYHFKRDENSKKIYPAEVMALEKKVAVAGSDISKAWIGRDEYQALIVQFRTTPEGAAKFAKATSEENRNKLLAIIIDNKIRSAPKINDPITTGEAQISGDFTVDEVNALARIIQEGALPVDLTIAQERTVGPSLGQDSIESGLTAFLIGFAGVMLFMVFYYKLSGIVSVIGLFLNTIFLFAMLSWLGFTLTLPGFAGIILTIGMAVDANVIIYERIKEELRSGKTVRTSILNGFDRAFWAIFDANITTLIMAFVLTQYGTGPIKGFAVTLAVGIVSSMFVALFITRFIFEVISLNKKLKKLSI